MTMDLLSSVKDDVVKEETGEKGLGAKIISDVQESV